MGARGNIDRASLDAVEQRFWRGIWDAAPAATVAEHGVELRRFGPIQVSLLGGLPQARSLNLVLGAASPGAAGEGHLEDAVSWADSLGADYYVPVTPEVQGAEEAEGWLRKNGFEPGYTWMKFVRDASSPSPEAPGGIEIHELVAGEGEDFGRIAAQGFGLPEWAGSLFRDLPGHEGWRCYVALVEGRAAACAAMFLDGAIAEFGIAATLESARGRGCQTALLRRRILDAADQGCDTLFVETGERTPDRPSGSYRNILRAGFEEAYLRPNWQRLAQGAP